jgi:hypothetical protein
MELRSVISIGAVVMDNVFRSAERTDRSSHAA